MKKGVWKLAALASALCLAGGLIPLAACGGGKVEISTFEQLVSEENSGKRMVLTADIDCGGKEIESITPESFDGQGHTIKNAVIASSSYAEKGGALFGRDTEEISNLTVEGFEVTGTYTGAIIKYGGECTITNVHVKDSSLEVKDGLYAGGIWAGYTEAKQGILGTSGSQFESATITDCSVENVNIKVASSKDYSIWDSGYHDIYAGGVAGTSIRTGASGCYAKGCTIEAVSNHVIVIPNVGGVFGTIQSFSKCYAEDNTITADASYWSDKQLSSASDTTPKAYVGGVVGLHSYGTATESYGKGNTIYAYSAGTVFAGGLAGSSGHKEQSSAQDEYIVDCYAAETSISAGHFAKDAVSCEDERYLGGLVGYMRYGVVRSCFAYKVAISDSNHADGTTKKYDTDTFRYGGFVGSASHGTFARCAGWGVSSIPAFDVFGEKVSSATNCYAYSDAESPLNASSCTLLDAEDWTGEGLKERLSLSAEVWSFREGEIPTLAF